MVEHTETHTCRSDKLVGVNKTAKRDPLPKPPGPWAWLSWLILVAYTIIFFEGLWVSQLAPSERGPALKRKLPHLCFVYALESALALGPGWCAMDGWTCGQVMQHHLPYIVAVTIAISLDLLGDWSIMATITLLTAANEGVLILIAMGAPEWIAKLRRLYGFSIVALLLAAELGGFASHMAEYWHRGREALLPALATQLMLGAIAYHGKLLRLYVRRWKKMKAL